MENRFESLKKGALSLHIELDDRKLEQFALFYELMIRQNEVLNLTRITEWEDVVTKHFLDSLSLSKFMIPEHEKIIDVGTGAGFPGIPLKIAFPEIDLTLTDSLKKRLCFLEEAVSALGLKGIEIVHGRAEELGQDSRYRERFDLCVSRAVASLPVLSEYCLPFVKNGGFFVSYTSGNVEEELDSADRAIRILGGQKKDLLRFTLWGTDQSRSLVLIEKAGATPPL